MFPIEALFAPLQVPHQHEGAIRHPTMHCKSPCVVQKLAVSNVKFDIQILSNNCHKTLNVFSSPLVLPSMAQMNSALYF